MDDSSARELKDRINRDEARLRRAQQERAGGGHAPVEDYPQHGAQPRASDPTGAEAARTYEDALRGELAAWQRLRGDRAARASSAAWDAWRTAVEERDRATRILINQILAARGP